MDSLLIANIFSFIGKLLFIVISFANTNNHMLKIQNLSSFFDSLACFMCGSYVGSITHLIIIVRNLITTSNKITNKIIKTTLMFIICITLVTLGIIMNTKGIYGFIPVIVTGSFTILITFTDNIKIIRVSLIINRLLWLIHDIHFSLYPAIFAGILVIIINTVKLIQLYLKEKQEQEQNQEQNQLTPALIPIPQEIIK